MTGSFDKWGITTPPISREQIVQAALTNGINEPLHTDKSAAVAAGFKDIYAPDALIFGTVCNALSQHTQGHRLTRLEINFGVVVYPEMILHLECHVFGESLTDDTRTLMTSFTVRADSGEHIADGTAYLAQSVPE